MKLPHTYHVWRHIKYDYKNGYKDRALSYLLETLRQATYEYNDWDWCYDFLNRIMYEEIDSDIMMHVTHMMFEYRGNISNWNEFIARQDKWGIEEHHKK